MKRILFLLLALLSLLPLAACGRGEGYAYDHRPSAYPSIDSFSTDGHAIRGGAYVDLELFCLEGRERREDEQNTHMKCLFSEDNKVLIPLCANAYCDHSSLECFGYVYGTAHRAFTTVREDSILCIREAQRDKGKKSDNRYEAAYYSFDGTLKKTVEFTPLLLTPTGSPIEGVASMGAARITDGSKVYFELSTEAIGSDYAIQKETSDIKYIRWIVSYDIAHEEWKLVTAIQTPLYEQYLGINDISEGRLSLESPGAGFSVDIETGEIEMYDCAAILDGLISQKKLPIGTTILDIYPLRDYFICYTGKELIYCRISTKELIDRNQVTVPTASERYKFAFNGELYTVNSTAGRSALKNTNTGETLTVDTPGYAIALFSETEKGLIFTYYLILPDGTLEPDCYTVKENYREETYFYPLKFLYVTKEDILDGTISEPWFYDPETYSFVLQ